MRNFVKIVIANFPAIISACTCSLMIFGLKFFYPQERISALTSVLIIISFLSIILIALLLAFIISKTNQLRFKGRSLIKEIAQLTQQVHYFRDIADLLLRSNMWTPGLKSYLEEEFSNLNYFLVKEFYKGRSKLALEYIEEQDRYGETEVLYLETKALLLNDPSKSKVTGYMNPRAYDLRILKKWNEHSVGMGWNHYFGFKYHQFKDALDIEKIHEPHQDKILKYATQIDTVRYQDMGFSEELLSMLGAHLSEEVVPQLLRLTLQSVQKIPRILTRAFVLLTIIILFGIFQPIVILLFEVPILLTYISLSIILSALLFILFSLYAYIVKEINE